jgi:hypothetical protein
VTPARGVSLSVCPPWCHGIFERTYASISLVD